MRHSFESFFWYFEAQSNMRLARQMIEFTGLNPRHNPANRRRVIQIGVVQKKFLTIDLRIAIEMIEPGSFQRTGTPNQTMNFIAFLQQELGQIRTVLPCDTSYECNGLHADSAQFCIS